MVSWLSRVGLIAPWGQEAATTMANRTSKCKQIVQRVESPEPNAATMSAKGELMESGCTCSSSLMCSTSVASSGLVFVAVLGAIIAALERATIENVRIDALGGMTMCPGRTGLRERGPRLECAKAKVAAAMASAPGVLC